MSYYLPTTLKLVRSYATLEKQGVKGENITSTKKSIGEILDTLSVGYEQQLDQLFKSDAIDIAADINVLENLMQQDGLTGEKSGFQTAAGSRTF
jgi:5-bromo-4-chloroindolyl phosphate hydrolysis protein